MTAKGPPLDFSITPALESPDGVYNFENPENIHAIIRISLGICLGTASLFLLLRAYTRFFIQKSHWWDDYLMIVAWLAFIVYVVLGLHGMKYGSGVHQWNVLLSDFFVFLKFSHILQVYYNFLIFVTKLSILLQLGRIFDPHRSGWTHRSIWFLIVFNALFYLSTTVAQLLTCLPREKIWHPLVEGKCLDLGAMLIAGAAVNIISDFALLILPIVAIWQLQLSNMKKVGVSAVFITGLFACLASIMRLVYNVRFQNTKDVTWDLTPVALWTMAEIACGIICGCLPALPTLFKRFGIKLKTTLGSLTGKRTTNNSDHSRITQESGLKHGPYIELDPQRSPYNDLEAPQVAHSQVALAK